MLPRYEADEFSASFISANKYEPGGLYLTPTGAIEGVAPTDLEYHYILMQAPNGQLIVRAYAVDNTKTFLAIEFFYGRLVDFAKAYNDRAYRLYRGLYPSKSNKCELRPLAAA